MGNFCGRDSAAVWASVGELASQTTDREKDGEWPAGDDSGAPDFDSAVVVNLNKELQVKIKITKRELEELVASASVREDRVLSGLINAVDHHHHHVHPRRSSWAPALYSIAE